MNATPVIEKIVDVNDFDQVMQIEVNAFQEPYTKDLYLFDFLHHPYSEYYKLILNNEIIGYVGLWILFNNAQITTIAINPKNQGLGYGKMLMNFTVSYVKENGCENITLEVRVSNQKAIQLYEKYNFYKVTIRKHYYENGEDAYLMKLDLFDKE